MRVFTFCLLAAPAACFLAPLAPKLSNTALKAAQADNDVSRSRGHTGNINNFYISLLT
jgi:hypothetical protein